VTSHGIGCGLDHDIGKNEADPRSMRTRRDSWAPVCLSLKKSLQNKFWRQDRWQRQKSKVASKATRVDSRGWCFWCFWQCEFTFGHGEAWFLCCG